jgi:alpha-ketoglutarate-dependent taurine dioxygenase
MALASVKLTPRVGSEIKIDTKTLLSGTAAAEIRELLEQRGVVIVRNTQLEDAQQLALAQTLGTVRLGTVRKEGVDGIMKVTFDKSQNNAYAEYFRGTFFWHMDGTYDDLPPLASILTPRVLAPSGGETEFTNTYAAYDDLPESEKESLETLKVVHTMAAAQNDAFPTPTSEQLEYWRSFKPKVHPLVWCHRSGRKSLVLSTSADHVVGMEKNESDALLGRLMGWATQRQYVYQHQWQMGDMLIWDNTGTMHRVLAFDMECGRRLHRVTLEGEEPVAAA